MNNGLNKGKLWGELLTVQYADALVYITFMLMGKNVSYITINVPRTKEVVAITWRLMIEDAKGDDDVISIPATSKYEEVIFRFTKSKSEIAFLDSDRGRVIRAISDIQGANFDELAEAIRLVVSG